MNALDNRWIISALAILCVEYLATFLIGLTVGFSRQVPFQTFAVTGSTLAAIGFAVAVVWQLFCLWREGQENPARHLVARLPWSVAVGIMLVACQFAVLNWAKVMMPAAVGFWADPMLAEFDSLLFGQDPWRISHQLFGQFTPLIDSIYAFWAPTNFVFLFFLLYLPACTDKTQAMTAYFLIMACGTLGQYLGASAGPIFYELLHLGDRFQDIPVTPWVANARDYLWSDYLRGGGLIGAGISAMPSVHVAVALWMALVARALLPRLQVIGWAYFAVILVGSVHLGWHYAIDGLVSCVLTLAAWRLAGAVSVLASRRQAA